MQQLVDTSLRKTSEPANIQETRLKILILLLTIVILLLLFIIGLRAYYLGIKQKTNNIAVTPIPSVVLSPTINPTLKITQIPSTFDLPSEVKNSSLYYVSSNKKLYHLSPLNSSPVILIDTVDSYEFSADRKKVAYTKEYGRNEIFILDLKTNNELIINGESNVNRGISWSPEGKYLLVDAGTGPEGMLFSYDSSSGDFLRSFGDGRFDWLDERHIFINQRTEVDPWRPWGAGEGYSLAKIDIVSGSVEIIIKADATNDYKIVKIDEPCVYYSREQVKEQDDWGDPKKMNINYYCLDLKTNETREELDSQAETDLAKLRNKLEKIFPEFTVINKAKIYEIIENLMYKDWIVMSIYKSGEIGGIYSSEIVIFNLQEPRNTLQKLGNGARITWF